MSVVLAHVPYAVIQRPSLGLSLLKAGLAQEGVKAEVVYPNLWWAEEVGLGNYELVASSYDEELLGDWIFAGAAFGEAAPRLEEYLDPLGLEMLQALVGGREALVTHLRELRLRACGFIDRAARRILSLRPRLVGAGSTFAQTCAALALLRRIRQLEPEVVTVMGGANCEMPMGGVILTEFPWVDFVMSGEADLTFGPFVRDVLRRGRALPAADLPAGMLGPPHRAGHPLPGADGRVARASTPVLDRVPTPDYDDWFGQLEASPIGAYVNPGLVAETSRGCWWGEKHHCTFCGLNGLGMSFRARSAERGLEELQRLSGRYGIGNFVMADNIIENRHIETLLPQVAEAQTPYNLFYETKANLRRDQLSRFAQAGSNWIQPGLESLHDGVLALIDKGTTAAINVQTMKWARELGLRLSWTILCGFPGERDDWYKEMADWVPQIMHLQPPQGVVQVRFDRFSPYHNRAEAYGVRLVPNRHYARVYPLPLERLPDFAYFFEDESRAPAGADQEAFEAHWRASGAAEAPSQPERFRLLMASATRRGQEGEGRQRLAAVVEEWVRNFWDHLPPILSMSDDGSRLGFLDTRPVAPARRHEIEGRARRVYLACETARSPAGLVRALASQGEEASWEELRPLVEDLCARRLLLPLSGRYLALAVAGEIPSLPTVHEYPGGTLRRQPRPAHPQDAPWRSGTWAPWADARSLTPLAEAR